VAVDREPRLLRHGDHVLLVTAIEREEALGRPQVRVLPERHVIQAGHELRRLHRRVDAILRPGAVRRLAGDVGAYQYLADPGDRRVLPRRLGDDTVVGL